MAQRSALSFCQLAQSIQALCPQWPGRLGADSMSGCIGLWLALYAR
ncbi:hypothetical protein LOY66_15565 [Pseudomonas viciae]|nr:hypothetical protein [Pseudomonas viciae]UZE84052.1 hypothetical protein LOY66_15565 [Pseudomonas viciae]